MIRHVIGIVSCALALAAFAPAGFALDPEDTPPTTATTTSNPANPANLSNSQLQGMVDKALLDRFYRDDDDDDKDKDDEETVKKTYRYDGSQKGTFFGRDLPQRTFNNIDYPY